MRFSESLDCVASFPAERHFGRLQSHIPEQWFVDALEATGTATIRRRRLPAEQVVWLVLAMALFRNLSIEELVERLNIALPRPDGASIAKSAIPGARARLGSEPMEFLFRRSGTVWAHESAARDRWRGLSLYGVDGTTVRVPDSRENRTTFGDQATRNGEVSGYPLVRVIGLMALRSHLLASAAICGFSEHGELGAATSLWSEVPDSSLTIIDRGFSYSEIFHSISSGGPNRHWLTRLRKTQKVHRKKRLDRGDYLVEIEVRPVARSKNPKLPPTIAARVITYRRPGFKPKRLLTSLLDDKKFPADELIALYHERWEIELGYSELKTRLLAREESIRSKSPEGVRQELWGLLLTYNLIRLEIERAATEARVSPLRISFVHAMHTIQTDWLIAAYLAAPGRSAEFLEQLRYNVKSLILPPRRPERSYPRTVKLKMSNYDRKRPKLK